VTLSPFLARIVLVGLALAAIHVPMIPVSHAADRLPVPDLLFCLLAAWAVRRPERLPLLLVVALGLLADLLQARPIGPGALGLVLATEVLRVARPGGMIVEWAGAAALFAALLAGTVLLLTLALVPGPGLAPLLEHWAATVIAYPFVAGIAQAILGGRARVAR
jgi:rod shape-determining protein MreD